MNEGYFKGVQSNLFDEDFDIKIKKSWNQQPYGR